MRSLHLLGLALLAAILCPTPAALAADINQKLHTIVLDDIDFNDVLLDEAVSLIRANSTRRDNQGEGVNIIIKRTVGVPYNPPITLKMSKPTLRVALDAVAQAGKLQMQIVPYGVLFSPDESTSPAP